MIAGNNNLREVVHGCQADAQLYSLLRPSNAQAHAVQPFGSPDACRAMDRWLGSRIYLSRQLAPTRWGLGA